MNNTKCIYRTSDNSKKVNIKLQHWLNETLHSNLDRFENFFGRNYTSVVLQPLATIIEIIWSKMSELKAYCNAFILMIRNNNNNNNNNNNQYQNNQLLDKIKSIGEDISKLNHDLINSKSMCIKSINTAQINDMINKKHEMKMGLSKVSVEIDLKIINLMAEGDPLGIKSLYASYNEIYWLSKNIEVSIGKLYSVFEERLESLINQFIILYVDPTESEIQCILQTIEDFNLRIEVGIEVLSNPPIEEVLVPFLIYSYSSFNPNSLYRWLKFILGKENNKLIPFGLKYEMIEPLRYCMCRFNEILIKDYFNIDELKGFIIYYEQYLEFKKNELINNLLTKENIKSIINGGNLTNVSIPFKTPLAVNRNVCENDILLIKGHLTNSLEKLYNVFSDFILKLKRTTSTFDNSNKSIQDKKHSIVRIGETLFISSSALQTLEKKK